MWIVDRGAGQNGHCSQLATIWGKERWHLSWGDKREAGRKDGATVLDSIKTGAASDPLLPRNDPLPLSSPFTPTDPSVVRASNVVFLPSLLFFTTSPSTYPRLGYDDTNHLFLLHLNESLPQYAALESLAICRP